jgi:hypothetical protein
MSINELFTTESKEATVSARLLSGTAELTRIASNVATDIIRKMEANIEEYRDRIQKSANDSKELDNLIEEFYPTISNEVEEDSGLRSLSDETVEGMLKSQQSKRSRSKSKAMTLDNYNNLMTAAVAENLLRELYNKPKAAHANFRRAGSIDYTPAQLEAFAEDQEALRREIRNVQSKKSIMKSREDFDPSSERWQALLKAEIMLKDLRVGSSTQVIEVDRTKDALTEMLNGVDTEHLKAADAKELLAAIMSTLGAE